ncbi:MAG TPA: aryl-sulfate sulfotransferase [Anaerolineaceae bacterium]|nr:aryl-sulfate sulfotransferase [Anaerolineaceae bacterium]
MSTSVKGIPGVLIPVVVIVAVLLTVSLVMANQPPGPQYLSPRPKAQFVSNGVTIAVRYGPLLEERLLSDLKFDVAGKQSGAHTGQIILADDRQTVIFKPDRPFTPGEQVQVKVSEFQVDAEHTYRPLAYAFSVGRNQKSWSPEEGADAPLPEMEVAFPDALTIPDDIPNFTVTASPAETADGYIFVAPFQWLHTEVGSYLLIVDNQGELVYYQPMGSEIAAYDFKKQPNGLLSYFSQADATYYLLDSHYQVVDSYQAGNGYRADLHEFEVLPNGNVLLMIYDSQQVDLSQYVRDGRPDAQVIALVIQEIDPSKNVVFEWRSWDHMEFRDSPVSLTQQDSDIDYVHGNSIDVDSDGNILVSSRNLNEVTKISRATGEILWRLGGKANEFTFTNDQPFGHQHDARWLANGNLTIFDNLGQPGPSRAVEYQIDEGQRMVNKVWEYAHNPVVFAAFMGNAQRLPNGNTLLGWGAPSLEEGFNFASITEVDAAGEPVFDLTFDSPFVSYRAFRFPWQGFPTTPPELAYTIEDGVLTLGYSWNGATEVDRWRVLGGSAPQPDELIEEAARTGFETQSVLTDLPAEMCYFQVVPVDLAGVAQTPSAVISTDPQACPLER